MYPISAVFSMFINDLFSCIPFSKFHFYPDDLQIYLSGDWKDLDDFDFCTQQGFGCNLSMVC
jgi:hypothetical protein